MKIDLFADFAFINGSVITVNKENEIVTAMAVKDNKIIYVGNDEGITPYIGEKTIVTNLSGKTLMPGFVEAHSHGILI